MGPRDLAGTQVEPLALHRPVGRADRVAAEERHVLAAGPVQLADLVTVGGLQYHPDVLAAVAGRLLGVQDEQVAEDGQALLLWLDLDVLAPLLLAAGRVDRVHHGLPAAADRVEDLVAAGRDRVRAFAGEVDGGRDEGERAAGTGVVAAGAG